MTTGDEPTAVVPQSSEDWQAVVVTPPPPPQPKKEVKPEPVVLPFQAVNGNKPKVTNSNVIVVLSTDDDDDMPLDNLHRKNTKRRSMSSTEVFSNFFFNF